MANYYNEINNLISKLLHKSLFYNLEGIALEGKKEVVSFLEIFVLRKIAKNEEKSISEIVEDIDINRSQLNSLIKKLVVKHYIQKMQSEEDRRVYLLRLTESGNEIVEESYNLQKKYLDFVLNDITLNEEKAILKFLSKLNQLDRV